MSAFRKARFVISEVIFDKNRNSLWSQLKPTGMHVTVDWAALPRGCDIFVLKMSQSALIPCQSSSRWQVATWKGSFLPRMGPANGKICLFFSSLLIHNVNVISNMNDVVLISAIKQINVGVFLFKILLELQSQNLKSMSDIEQVFMVLNDNKEDMNVVLFVRADEFNLFFMPLRSCHLLAPLF